jgi:hypothetical protein
MEPLVRGYNWATLFLGDINKRTWPSRLGESPMRQQIWSWVLRDLDPRVTALARPRSNCTSKLQTHPLVREGDPRQETRNCQTETKIWSWAPAGTPKPRQTGRLTGGRNLTSTSISTSTSQLASAFCFLMKNLTFNTNVRNYIDVHFLWRWIRWRGCLVSTPIS